MLARMSIAPFYVLTMAVCCGGGADPAVPLTEAQEAELIAEKLCSPEVQGVLARMPHRNLTPLREKYDEPGSPRREPGSPRRTGPDAGSQSNTV